MLKRFILNSAVFLFVLSCLPAQAQQVSFGAQADGLSPAQFELVSPYRATGSSGTQALGLRVTLEQGWKIYWRSPGDAGLPPELSLSKQMPQSYDVKMAFPTPERFSLFGLDTFGYSEEVIFPVSLSGHPAGTPLYLDVIINALVCSDICIPISDVASLFLPSGASEPSEYAQPIARFVSAVPKVGAIGGLDLISASLVQADALQNRAALRIEAIAPDSRLDDILVESSASGLSFSAPKQISKTIYEVEVKGDQPGQLMRSPVTFTLISEKLAAEFTDISLSNVTPVPPVLAQQDSLSGSLFLAAVLAAFLGGLILNVMPCVLPVLVLKVHALISSVDMKPSQVRLRLATGAAGIMCSFMVLAAALVSIKMTGGQLGWGVQFQNLWFLSLMAVLMSLFSLSLFDRFDITFPAFSVRSLEGRAPVLVKDFISGFLATALATPCSAPFVGTAVSFAFAAPPLTMFTILTIMGLGLAFPWIILALLPQAVSLLPRPGRWMQTVKVMMGVGLCATIMWLIWLVWAVSGPLPVLLLSIGLVILFVSAFLRQPVFLIILASCVAVILPSAISQLGFSSLTDTVAHSQSPDIYRPYSEQALADAVATGRPVFVDVTAAWCITCQVNKKLVLEDEKVRSAFAEKQVILMRADWTEPNDEIAAFLARHGRFAIPFNILFTDSDMTGEPFPELLSKDSILTVLNRLNS